MLQGIELQTFLSWVWLYVSKTQLNSKLCNLNTLCVWTGIERDPLWRIIKSYIVININITPVSSPRKAMISNFVYILLYFPHNLENSTRHTPLWCLLVWHLLIITHKSDFFLNRTFFSTLPVENGFMWNTSAHQSPPWPIGRSGGSVSQHR